MDIDPKDFWERLTLASYIGLPEFSTGRPFFIDEIENIISNWSTGKFKTDSISIQNLLLKPTGVIFDLSKVRFNDEKSLSDATWAQYEVYRDSNEKVSGMSVFIESTFKSGIMFVAEFANMRRILHYNYGDENSGSTSHRPIGAEYLIGTGEFSNHIAKPTTFISDNKYFNFSLIDDTSTGKNIMKLWHESGTLVAGGVFNSSENLIDRLTFHPLSIMANQINVDDIRLDANVTKLLGFIKNEEKLHLNS